MKVLNKFTIKSLKLNKKRTITTIIGIMLSSALICGVAGLVSSFQKSLVEWTIKEDGNYHTTFYNVQKDKIKYISENQKVKAYYLMEEEGWAKLEGSKNNDKPYVHIMKYDQKALENYGVNLKEGRLPKDSNEIVIPEHIKTNARVNIKVGDVINLDVGKRVLQDGTELTADNPYIDDVDEEEHIINTTKITYTVVGIIERLYAEGYSEPGYTAITLMKDVTNTANVATLYKNPKGYEEINESIIQAVDGNSDDIRVNRELLRYQGVLGDSILRVLYSIAGIVIFIIVISSVFVIRNSFSTSVAEKNKQYGVLSSIGATARQIKKNVIFEGMAIGLIAIPLGILLGIVAIMILLEVVNNLIGDMLNGGKFIYYIESVAILISIFISIITIYLSCLIPAKRAAKIPPIESIRGNNDIKVNLRKIRTSKITKKVFGIGGVIASKNLKRSRKKYRTTVISIVVSIFIFISLSSFLSLGTKVSTVYYTDFKFNLYTSNANESIYKELAQLENIDNYSYYYTRGLDIDNDKYCSEFGKEVRSGQGIIQLIVYNNEYFKKYVTELGLKETEYKTAAILTDEIIIENNNDGSKTLNRIYNIDTGDEITVKENERERNIKITKYTDYRPMGIEGTYYGDAQIIVSQDFVKEVLNEAIDETYDLSDLFIYSDSAEELENSINDLKNQNERYEMLEIFNANTYVKQMKRMLLVVKIFLYGFISVISLIGVTNIFNIITTNMVLRSKEFAMLKSIGMTKKEFNRMIRLESIMYGAKALSIGIPLGILGSYGVYKAFSEGVDIGYSFPVLAIIISIIFVFIIVRVTMRYSLNKINKQNIIETIREENI